MCFGISFDRPVIYNPPSCVSGITLTGQWYILPRHVFWDLLWKTSDIYCPVMCFGIYFERPVIYTPLVMCFGIYVDRPMIYTPSSCVSGFTLTDQWYILPRHVFRDLRWQTSDIYSPSCVSGFTLTCQWYILTRHVFRPRVFLLSTRGHVCPEIVSPHVEFSNTCSKQHYLSRL